MPIHAPFCGVFGEYFPHMTSSIVLAPKRTIIGQKHVIWAIQRKNQCDGSTWAQDRVKNKTVQQKVTKVLYFPYLEGSPRWADSTLKLHGGWCPRRNHVCRASNWNLHGLRFYRGRIFDFPIDFNMGLTTVYCLWLLLFACFYSGRNTFLELSSDNFFNRVNKLRVNRGFNARFCLLHFSVSLCSICR